MHTNLYKRIVNWYIYCHSLRMRVSILLLGGGVCLSLFSLFCWITFERHCTATVLKFPLKLVYSQSTVSPREMSAYMSGISPLPSLSLSELHHPPDFYQKAQNYPYFHLVKPIQSEESISAPTGWLGRGVRRREREHNGATSSVSP